VQVRVKTSDGAIYTSLFETTSTSYSIDSLRPTSDLWYWRPNPPADAQGWNTGVLDANGARMYKAGTYTVYAELNLNKIQGQLQGTDGSDYTGKTVSATRQ